VDLADYWLVLGLLAGLGGFGFLRGFRWWRWARLIEDTPTSRVRSAAQGYVELIGRGRSMPGAPVLAPLSRRPCTWYRYTVERRSRDSKNRNRWNVVSRGSSEALFLLDDDSGQCIVDPAGAEVLPTTTDTWYGDTPLPVAGPPLQRGFRGFGRDYRYRESRMHAGDPLYAIGWFRTEDGLVAGALQDDVAALLRRWKRDAPALHQRFDTDGDGVLSLAEWERAREAAHEEVMGQRRRQSATPGVHVLARPALAGKPFLLAAGDAPALARRYRRHAAGGLALFLAAATALAWVLIEGSV